MPRMPKVSVLAATQAVSFPFDVPALSSTWPGASKDLLSAGVAARSAPSREQALEARIEGPIT